jgi:hypothetical protein
LLRSSDHMYNDGFDITEVQIARKLIDAGYRVMDRSQVTDITKVEIERALDGYIDVLIMKARDYGADVVLYGGVIRGSRNNNEFGLYTCQLTYTYKALVADTREILCSGSIIVNGAGATPGRAATTALGRIADKVSPPFMSKVSELQNKSYVKYTSEVIVEVLDISPDTYNNWFDNVNLTQELSIVSLQGGFRQRRVFALQHLRNEKTRNS